MSAKRHIVSFEVFGKPFLQSDWEYVELRVKGQSFMILKKCTIRVIGS